MKRSLSSRTLIAQRSQYTLTYKLTAGKLDIERYQVRPCDRDHQNTAVSPRTGTCTGTGARTGTGTCTCTGTRTGTGATCMASCAIFLIDVQLGITQTSHQLVFRILFSELSVNA